MPGGGHRFPTPPEWMFIGTRKRPKPKPRPAAPFESALGDLMVVCPSCRPKDEGPFRDGRAPLDLTINLWPCTHCDGVFVESAAFEAMVIEMAHVPYELPPISGAPGPRGCPACDRPMAVERLGTATVDRCAQHGIWFDETELAEALQTAVPASGGVLSWIKQLFFAP